ncbi:MAG: AAA family ATPase [Aquiluna sp.]|nr:AAA family ATPase [Aquiluna sp.]MCF8546214.1 AAA family ATPase [Aquiluna sp.]
MAIILETDRLNVDQIRAALNEPSQVCTTVQDAHEIMESKGDNLVIVGPTVSMQQVSDMSKHCRVTRPSLGVVVVRDYVSEHDLRLALESGIRSVVTSGDATALQNAIASSTMLSDEISAAMGMDGFHHMGKIFMSFSPKGGVGKTTFAVNLAASLAQNSEIRVCLIDLDLNFGDVAMFLDKIPDVTLGNLATAQGQLSRNTISGLSTSIDSNFDAILSPSHPGIGESLEAGRILELLKLLRRNYDYVIVDSTAQFTDLNMDVFELADEIYILSTPDVASIKDLKTALNVMQELGITRNKQKIIINRLDPRISLKITEVEALIGIKTSLQIPEYRDAIKALNQGQTLVTFRRSNPISTKINGLVKALLEVRFAVSPSPAMPEPAPETSAPSGLKE